MFVAAAESTTPVLAPPSPLRSSLRKNSRTASSPKTTYLAAPDRAQPVVIANREYLAAFNVPQPQNFLVHLKYVWDVIVWLKGRVMIIHTTTKIFGWLVGVVPLVETLIINIASFYSLGKGPRTKEKQDVVQRSSPATDNPR